MHPALHGSGVQSFTLLNWSHFFFGALYLLCTLALLFVYLPPPLPSRQHPHRSAVFEAGSFLRDSLVRHYPSWGNGAGRRILGRSAGWVIRTHKETHSNGQRKDLLRRIHSRHTAYQACIGHYINWQQHL
ncbi:hypothetical protein L209DRAFT_225194 [Thermothelomyces heterothallicus CBS 203.75]